jgi:hypothetical protein
MPTRSLHLQESNTLLWRYHATRVDWEAKVGLPSLIIAQGQAGGKIQFVTLLHCSGKTYFMVFNR